jgi:3-hydroxybutyryl-CoA dehydrogenase
VKPKKTKARTNQKRAIRPEATKAIVYIVGEVANVEVYAALCANHGYAVLYYCPESAALPASLSPIGARRQSKVPATASFALELTNVDLEQKRRNLELLDKTLPATTAIASSSVTVTATEQASWIRQKHRLVGCSILPTLTDKPLVEVAPTVFSPAATVQVVQKFFGSLGKEIELVQDRIGMVFPRILCQMINEAAFALQEEIANPEDLDLAMKIGAGYPVGPIAWAEGIGLKQLCAVLKALSQDLGEERIRISPLLTQMAHSGSWWQRTQAIPKERH